MEFTNFLFSRTQEVIKDASPEDYNNEELYQVMEKIYYVVSSYTSK